MKKELFCVCPQCGANHTAGNLCECQQIDINVDEIPQEQINRLARSALRAVAKSFEDPSVMAEFKVWQKEYRKRKNAVCVADGA